MTQNLNHRLLLQLASNNFGCGICLEAEKFAAQAIAAMQLSFSAHNPQLADAYALHGDICREIVRSYHGASLKADYQQRWLQSARAEIACRSLGCETEALAKVRFRYGRSLATSGDTRGYKEIAQAMLILERLSQQDDYKRLVLDWL